MKRKLIVIMPSLTGGGAERVILTLLTHLDRSVYSPQLVILDAAGPLQEIVPSGIPVHDLETPRLRKALFRLVTIVRSQRPDIIISSVCHINLALLALRPVFFNWAKVIVREANTPSKNLAKLQYANCFHKGYKLLYPKADKVICLSRQMADEIIQQYGVASKRMAILFNPVDVTKLRGIAGKPARFPGDGVRFVAAGRLTRQKGFDRLIEMCASIAESAHISILGEGEQNIELRNMITSLGLDSRIQLAGFNKEPWSYYAGADAFLLPSRWEGMPNAALEALACGTPVIATPEAGAIEEIRDMAGTGFVTIAEAGPPFIDAMNKVKPDPPLKPRPSLLPMQFMSQSAQERFSEILEETFSH